MTLYHLPSQVFISTIVLIVLLKTYQSAKLQKMNKPFLFIWLSFWLIVLMSIFNLGKLSQIAQAFGIGRGVDFVIYLSLIALFYFLYSLMVKYKQVQENMTKIVRELAIRDVKNKV